MREKFPQNPFVPPKLGPSLRVVVAEAPGSEESVKGEPLVGSSGRIFDALCRKAGIQRDQLTIINTINCRPPDNVYPTDAAARTYCTESEANETVRHCFQHHVRPILESRPWSRIDALGGKSLEALTGTLGGIQKWRGSPLPLKGEDKPRVIPILHPAYLMRDQTMIPVTISDLKKGTNVPPEFYNTKPTLQDVIDFRFSSFCFDIETNMFTKQITMVGICARPYHVIVVPFQGHYIDELKRIFREAKQVIGHNIIGFDLPTLVEAGCAIPGDCQIWDTILMQHLVQPDLPHDLEFVSSIFTQKPAWKHLSSQDMPLYCARDVDVTMQSFAQLKPLLPALNLEDLYKYTQVPLAKICSLLERQGIRTDGERAKKVREQLIAEIVELEKLLPVELQPYDKPIRVRQLAPKGTLGKSGKPVKYTHIPGTKRIVPWNSPDRVEQYLYVTLGLPKQVNAKTKRVSTDKTALDKLFRKTHDPAIDAIRQIRKKDELVSNFLKEGNIGVGKIHPHFSPFGTNSGRLSSAGPNMQNQPETARYIYVPSSPDWCLVEADFASGENRLTAWYADDQERLKRLAIPGFSEHKMNANTFFGIPYEVDYEAGKIIRDEVVHDNRRDAPYGMSKALTHGINYGEGARKIAQTLDLPEKDVKDWLFKWRQANLATVAFQERTAAQAEKEGVLTTVFNRKRWFWTNRVYTESLSFLPQSTLADISFRAMIGLMYDRIEWPAELALKVTSVLAPLPHPARLLLQVHDSLLVECPRELVARVASCLKAVMEQPWPQMGGFSIPAEFNVGGVGDSWGELRPYKV
jgi:uracil-DNA glycosylase family 4